MGRKNGAKGNGERDASSYHWKALKVLLCVCTYIYIYASVCINIHTHIYTLHTK